jgi:hypothetical protein
LNIAVSHDAGDADGHTGQAVDHTNAFAADHVNGQTNGPAADPAAGSGCPGRQDLGRRVRGDQLGHLLSRGELVEVDVHAAVAIAVVVRLQCDTKQSKVITSSS